MTDTPSFARARGRKARARRLSVLFTLFASALASTGCKVGYVFQQAGGQFRILTQRRDVAEVLEDPAVPATSKEKLRLIAEVKRFAEDEIGLARTDNYTTYYDTGGKPVAWSVVACPPDSLSPIQWWFPIVGSVSYLGYFDRESAEECRRELAEEGHDTHLGRVSAYSTLGWFSDPVFSPMLDDTEGGLANLIIHETTHATVYCAGNSAFNENLAEFVGAQGELDWLAHRHGADCEAIRRTLADRADERIFLEFVATVAKRLTAVYARDLPREAKLAEKRRVLDEAALEFDRQVKKRFRTGGGYTEFDPRRLNNAFIAAYQTYHSDTDVLTRVYEALGRDLRQFVVFFGRIPGSADPLAFARGWLALPAEERTRALESMASRQAQQRERRPDRS